MSLRLSTIWLVLLLPLAVAGCGGNTRSEVAAPVRAAQARQPGGRQSLHLSGRVEPDVHKEVEVRPKIAGRVVEIVAEPGEKVKKGQTLCRVDSRDISQLQSELLEARSKLRIAEAQVERERQVYEEQVERPTSLIKARADFDEARVQKSLCETEHYRMRKLHKEKIVAAKDFIAAQAKLARAHTRYRETEAIFRQEQHLYENRTVMKRDYQLARAEARRQSDHVNTLTQRLLFNGCDKATLDEVCKTGKIQGSIRLQAPIDGILTYKEIAEGEFVRPTMLLFKICDMSTVLLKVDLPESDLGRVHVGDPVSVSISSYPQEKFEGQVSYIGIRVDEKTRTLPMRVRLDNDDGRLKQSMLAHVKLRGAM